MTGLVAANSAGKTKAVWAEHPMEEVRVPSWLTNGSAFPGSLISEMLTIPNGSSYGFFVRPADPFGVSTASISRAIDDVVKSWLTENLTDPAALDPADYLFDSAASEKVPSAWLEAVFAMHVTERHELVMDGDE